MTAPTSHCVAFKDNYIAFPRCEGYSKEETIRCMQRSIAPVTATPSRQSYCQTRTEGPYRTYRFPRCLELKTEKEQLACMAASVKNCFRDQHQQ